MRLRNANVEYKVCLCTVDPEKPDTKPFEFEGDRCPACKTAFDPAIHRLIVRRRIIVSSLNGNDVVYVRYTDRVRCPQDGNLYDPVESRIRNFSHTYIEWRGTHAESVEGCGAFLFPKRKEQIVTMSNADFRKLRNAALVCPECDGAVAPARYNPLDSSDSIHPTRKKKEPWLPAQTTSVWRRVYFRTESVEELIARERLAGKEDVQDEDLETDEEEEENENE